MPDVQNAVDLRVGAQDVVGLLAGRRERPVGEGLLDDLHARVGLDDLHEALVAVVVGGHAADAAHLDDVALAAEVVDEPLGAEPAVLDLVVGDHVRLGRGDGLVDGHDDDVAGGGLLDDRVQRLTIGRVDDDRVGTRRDQVADAGDLRAGVAVDVVDEHFVDLPRGEGLGLHRADHLLAPAVTHEGVADADLVRLLLLRRTAGAGAAAALLVVAATDGDQGEQPYEEREKREWTSPKTHGDGDPPPEMGHDVQLIGHPPAPLPLGGRARRRPRRTDGPTPRRPPPTRS